MFQCFILTVTRAEWELQQSEFIILSSLSYLPSKNSNIKQHTPTHHQNDLKLKHKSTGRCTPRQHDALLPSPYAYERNKAE